MDRSERQERRYERGESLAVRDEETAEGARGLVFYMSRADLISRGYTATRSRRSHG